MAFERFTMTALTTKTSAVMDAEKAPFCAQTAPCTDALRVLVQRTWRRIALLESPAQRLRKLLLRVRGALIGAGTHIPKLLITWPHQVSLGRDCILQPDIFFNYSHYWTSGPSMLFGDRVFIGRGCEFNIREKITVGNDCLIASGCLFVDSDHGTASDTSINTQPLQTAAIVLEPNVWLGARCVILKGVHIGKGAIVGAGSVVTKSIPAGEIWAGVPARRLRASETLLQPSHPNSQKTNS